MSRSSTRSKGRMLAGGVLALLAGALLLSVLRALVHPSQRVLAGAAAAETQPVLEHPDRACRQCHQQIYDSYERTPMALASGAAADGLDRQELLARGLVHEPSGIRYAVTAKGGKVTLSYFRAQTGSKSGLDGTEDLRLFIGSGRRGRTFLYQEDDLWFETPINWYGKKALWDMAPAYGEATSLPSPLPVDPNCLHCHAGQVQRSVDGVRNRFAGQPFRSGGVGCTACHGDPAAHLLAMAQRRPAEGTAGGAEIVNPDTLRPVLRDSVCLQCHLEGDATVFRPGRSLAGFVPGQDLSESAVYFVDRTRAQEGGRASSQYEALLRSACKRGAGDKLTCTTCHDPHSSPAPAERVAFFRAKCLACHSSPAIAVEHHPEQQDCATCHMPTRKTLDISHEQLTDHDVEAVPQRSSPARVRTQTPELVPVGHVTVTLREEGLAYAQLAQHGDRTSGERALKLLQAAARGGSDDPELHDQLGFLLQRAGLPGEAAAQYLQTLREQPLDVTAAANLAVLDASRGQAAEAIALLRQLVVRDPSQTTAGLNLAFLECRTGQKEDALGVVRAMLRFSPDSAAAHTFLEQGVYGGQSCRLR